MFDNNFWDPTPMPLQDHQFTMLQKRLETEKEFIMKYPDFEETNPIINEIIENYIKMANQRLMEIEIDGEIEDPVRVDMYIRSIIEERETLKLHINKMINEKFSTFFQNKSSEGDKDLIYQYQSIMRSQALDTIDSEITNLRKVHGISPVRFFMVENELDLLISCVAAKVQNTIGRFVPRVPC